MTNQIMFGAAAYHHHHHCCRYCSATGLIRKCNTDALALVRDEIIWVPYLRVLWAIRGGGTSVSHSVSVMPPLVILKEHSASGMDGLSNSFATRSSPCTQILWLLETLYKKNKKFEFDRLSSLYSAWEAA